MSRNLIMVGAWKVATISSSALLPATFILSDTWPPHLMCIYHINCPIESRVALLRPFLLPPDRVSMTKSHHQRRQPVSSAFLNLAHPRAPPSFYFATLLQSAINEKKKHYNIGPLAIVSLKR